jgi:hypothetical protein
MQFKISYVASQCKEIYSNKKRVARMLDQGFVCSWAWKKKKASTSVCSLK